MPRPRTDQNRQSGTTKSDLRKRRARRAGSDRLRRWRRRGAGLLVLLLGLGGLVYSGLPGRAAYGIRLAWYRMTAGDGLLVRNIYVEGRQNTDAAQLRRVIGVKAGDPLLEVDPRDEAAALSRLPWVRDVRVERRLPDTVYIRLTERQPLALWQDHGKLRLIDADGAVLSDADLRKFASLPLVVGGDAPDHAARLLRDLASAPALQGQFDAATWLPGQRWDIRLKNKQLIQLPAGNIPDALQVLNTTAGRQALANPSVTLIDLREPGRIAVRTANVR